MDPATYNDSHISLLLRHPVDVSSIDEPQVLLYIETFIQCTFMTRKRKLVHNGLVEECMCKYKDKAVGFSV